MEKKVINCKFHWKDTILVWKTKNNRTWKNIEKHGGSTWIKLITKYLALEENYSLLKLHYNFLDDQLDYRMCSWLDKIVSWMNELFGPFGIQTETLNVMINWILNPSHQFELNLWLKCLTEDQLNWIFPITSWSLKCLCFRWNLDKGCKDSLSSWERRFINWLTHIHNFLKQRNFRKIFTFNLDSWKLEMSIHSISCELVKSDIS